MSSRSDSPILRVGFGIGGGIGVAGLALMVLKFYCVVAGITLMQSQVLGPVMLVALASSILIANQLPQIRKHKLCRVPWIFVPIGGMALIGHLVNVPPESVIAGTWRHIVGDALFFVAIFLMEILRHRFMVRTIEQMEREEWALHSDANQV